MTSLYKQFTQGLAAFMLVGASVLHAQAPATSVRSRVMEFTLDQPGDVSAAVYDPAGLLVRELLHAAPMTVGKHAMTWDGLDHDGNSLPAGNYTWKLLQTTGLKAKYLMSLGSSFPPGNTWQTACGPGTHIAPYGIAVDTTGVYVAAFTTENIETCMLKMPSDGHTRLWSALTPMAWDGALSLAVDGGEVFMLGHTAASPDPRVALPSHQHVFIYDAATGEKALRGAPAPLPTRIDVHWEPTNTVVEATDMDVNGGVLVVAYAKKDALRWYDTQTGEKLDRANIESPQGVTVGVNGLIYISSGDSIVTLSRDSKTPVVFATGLANLGRLDIDHSSGDLIVYLKDTQQIARYSAAGTLLKTYGQPGGRQDGLYDDAAKRNFAGFADLCADGGSGFYVTEAKAAPRRTAHFATDGSVIQEWYGGQRWAPHGEPEPDNPNVVWMGSGYGWVMRVLVDYDAGTWEVHSTYQYSHLATGLVGDSWNEGGYFGIQEHEGTKYLVLEKQPTILKIDEENWQLVPVTIMADIGGGSPEFIHEWGAGKKSFQWNDTTGDGIPQEEEFTFYTQGIGSRLQPVVDRDFNYFSFGWPNAPEPFEVRKLGVEEWNAVGAPIYGVFEDNVFTEVPLRFRPDRHQDTRWSAFLFSDTATGDLFGGFNSWTVSWGSSDDSFMHRWDAAGLSKWTVSEQGHMPGYIHHNFRGIAGVAHDCVIAYDFDGGWNMSNLAVTYIWDRDGLYVGGIMDQPDLDGIADYWYQLSGELCHAAVHTLPNGDVLFFGNWENEIRVYRVTGWDGWKRQSGHILVDEARPSHQGQGLTARYFETPQATEPSTVRIDLSIDFDWGQAAPEASGIMDPGTYVVSWRGTVLPEYGVAFDGPWGPKYQAGAYQERLYGTRAHAAATLRFRGNSIRAVGSTGPNQGYLEVYLDGEKVAENIDTYSPEVQLGVTLFERSGLPLADHELKVVGAGWRATRNPATSDTYVYLDKFVVDDAIEIDGSGMEYTFVIETDNGVHLWMDHSLHVARHSAEGGTAGAPISTSIQCSQQHLPIQLDLTKVPEDAGKVRLLWSTPFSELTPVPQDALYPVERGVKEERPLFSPQDPGGTVTLPLDCVLDRLSIRNPHDGPGGDFEQVFDLNGHMLEIDYLEVARRDGGNVNKLKLDLGNADVIFKNGQMRVNKEIYVAGMEVPLLDGSHLSGSLAFDNVELDLTGLSRMIVGQCIYNLRSVEGVLDLQGARLVNGQIRVETLFIGREDNAVGRILLSEATGLRELVITQSLEIGNSGGYGRIGMVGDERLPDGVKVRLGVGPEARASFKMASQSSRLGADSNGSLIAGEGGDFIAYLNNLTVGQRGVNPWGVRSLGMLDLRGMDEVWMDVDHMAIALRESAVQTVSGYTARGEVYLPTGTVTVRDLSIAKTPSDGGLAEGLLDLSGTHVSVSGQFLLGTGGATHSEGLGRVVIRLFGQSSGLDLAADANVEIGERGRIELIFESASEPPVDAYYGLRWEGDHRQFLQEMVQAEPARLIWDDAKAGGTVSIFLHEGTTYVGVRK